MIISTYDIGLLERSENVYLINSGQVTVGSQGTGIRTVVAPGVVLRTEDQIRERDPESSDTRLEDSPAKRSLQLS